MSRRPEEPPQRVGDDGLLEPYDDVRWVRVIGWLAGHPTLAILVIAGLMGGLGALVTATR